jgi:pyruvate dehydrogenase E2 component (dihydrolipoamide acetyltransferase)
MPKIGQAMAQGVVVEWHRRDGEYVDTGDAIATIETDKSTYELEAQASGELHIAVDEGHEVPVGHVLAVIGGTGSAVSTSAPAPLSPAAVTAEASAAEVSTVSEGHRVLASPKARRLAAERGVDLAIVTTSSADGVISASGGSRKLHACDLKA